MNSLQIKSPPSKLSTGRIIEHPAAKNLRKQDSGKYWRICLPIERGLRFVDPNEIKYCRALSNYSEILLNTGEKIVISKTLKWLGELLSSEDFIRPHASYIANVNAIRTVENKRIELRDSSFLPISRSRQQLVLDQLKRRCHS